MWYVPLRSALIENHSREQPQAGCATPSALEDGIRNTLRWFAVSDDGHALFLGPAFLGRDHLSAAGHSRSRCDCCQFLRLFFCGLASNDACPRPSVVVCCSTLGDLFVFFIRVKFGFARPLPPTHTTLGHHEKKNTDDPTCLSSFSPAVVRSSVDLCGLRLTAHRTGRARCSGVRKANSPSCLLQLAFNRHSAASSLTLGIHPNFPLHPAPSG